MEVAELRIGAKAPRWRLSSPPHSTLWPGAIVGLSNNTILAAAAPRIFLKSTRTILENGHELRLRPHLGALLAEAELAVVIGAPAENLRPGSGADCILGWTIANDITAIERIGRDGYLQEAKGGAGFTPLLSQVRDDFEDTDAAVRILADGVPVGEGRTSSLRMRSGELVEWVSGFMRLDAGDVILSGALAAVPITAGTSVTVEIDGLGSLTTPVTT